MFFFLEKHDYKIENFMEEIFIKSEVFFDDNLSENINGGNFDLSSVAGKSGTDDFNKILNQSHLIEKLKKLLKYVFGLFSGPFIWLSEGDHNLWEVGFDEIENVLNISFILVVTFNSLPELF